MNIESQAEEGLPPGNAATIVDVVAQQVVVPLSLDRTDELEAAAVLDVLRQEGFDLRRRMFVAYVLDFAARREDAYAASQSLRDTDWDTSLYGDASGWVLRLSRVRKLTREAVLDDIIEARGLAMRCHGQVRGVTVEDLRRADVWAEMAARLAGGSRRRSDEDAAADAAAAIPAPRRQTGTRGVEPSSAPTSSQR